MVQRIIHMSQPGISEVEEKIEAVMGAINLPDAPQLLPDGTPDPETWGLGVAAYEQQQAFFGTLESYKPGAEVPRDMAE